MAAFRRAISASSLALFWACSRAGHGPQIVEITMCARRNRMHSKIQERDFFFEFSKSRPSAKVDRIELKEQRSTVVGPVACLVPQDRGVAVKADGGARALLLLEHFHRTKIRWRRGGRTIRLGGSPPGVVDLLLTLWVLLEPVPRDVKRGRIRS